MNIKLRLNKIQLNENETHLSTQPAQTREQTRISSADGLEEWAQTHRPPARQGTQSLNRKRYAQREIG